MNSMLPAPVLHARIPRPITDERLAQAHAAEELSEALLRDLYLDMQHGAAMQACNYRFIERRCQPRAVVRVAGHNRRQRVVALPQTRDPEPVTRVRFERALAAEQLLDAMLEDLFEDLVSGAAVVSRKYKLVRLHKPARAISLALQCATG
jgi:hypothetical protein